MSKSTVIDATIILCMFLGLLDSLCVGSGLLIFSYLAGRINADYGISSLGLLFFLLALGCFLAIATLVLGILRFTRWQWIGRGLWASAMLLPLIMLITVWIWTDGHTHGAARAYEAGFHRWAKNIDDSSIRKWAAALPPPPEEPVSVSKSSWPSAARDVRPLDLRICSTGVILSWPSISERHVFIANDPAASSPAMYPERGAWHIVAPGTPWNSSPWQPLKPGVYAWVQSGG